MVAVLVLTLSSTTFGVGCEKFTNLVLDVMIASEKRGDLFWDAVEGAKAGLISRGLAGAHELHGIGKPLEELAATADKVLDGRGPLFELIDALRHPDIAGLRRPFTHVDYPNGINVDLVLGNPLDPVTSPTKLIECYGSDTPNTAVAIDKLHVDIDALAALLNAGTAPAAEVHVYGQLTAENLSELQQRAAARAAAGKPVVGIVHELKSVVGNLD
ncbi:MAG: hypothetical protein HZA54_10775 [Planctomycetes bacterium]|nr:hypothetical protein [Planctomycetota bacterium]